MSTPSTDEPGARPICRSPWHSALRATEQKTPMKRFKKILKWTGIVAGAAIAALLIANVLLVRSTGYRLEGRLSALRRAGEPLKIADLGREPIPPEKNADTFLRRAADDLQAIQKELEALYPRVG